MKYIVKYSGEMTTKSRVVRTQFCRQLRKNLARLFRVHLQLNDKAAAPHDPDAIEVDATWDHIQIQLSPEKLALAPQVEAILANTPGVWSFNRVLAQPLGTFEDMVDQVLKVYRERLNGNTFVVRCRRVGKHAFNSMDVERYVGGGLRQRSEAAGVDLHKPQVVVQIEIRNQTLFIIDASIDGIGGFPLGTQDSVISLISGGFDSAVASYLSMKRGLRTHFLFFNLGGREHEIAVKEVALYLWLKFGASHGVQFITVPFEGVVAEILDKIDNPMMGVVLKRMMMRVATAIADHYEVEALVTGESVAQVSSQTLTNLAVISDVTPKMLLRPLIMTDKQDIVDLARKIGTEEFSAVIPEYCGVISVKPTTRAKRHRIEHEEQRFDFAVLERAIAERVALDIRTMEVGGSEVDSAAEAAPEDLSHVPHEQLVILDIRHPDEEERRPLTGAPYPVERVPFFRLNTRFTQLPHERHYLLYCDKGVMSRLHASHLREQGHVNVGVYRK
ncbi:MAG TPA: tRNA uracil 4-sulfurtransferase ThiI [Candidatus Acidoferrum sp.]|nr:tRNA uracil 4-sulfurtransferase ThiI [Candidatus Acidoferrum sp.]